MASSGLVAPWHSYLNRIFAIIPLSSWFDKRNGTMTDVEGRLRFPQKPGLRELAWDFGLSHSIIKSHGGRLWADGNSRC
jgi:hypothetical protein